MATRNTTTAGAKELEISRSNVTLSQFLSYVRSRCEAKRLEMFDPYMFADPDENVASRGTVADGEGQQILVIRPCEYHCYERFGGYTFNEICEFTYDDERKGSGYYYQYVREDATEAA